MSRDRAGEEIDDQPADEDAAHHCDRGWVHYATRRPCRICRPWLVARPARPPTAAELTRFRARHG